MQLKGIAARWAPYGSTSLERTYYRLCKTRIPKPRHGHVRVLYRKPSIQGSQIRTH